MVGVYGAGKTTLVELLAQELESRGASAVIAADAARASPLPLNRGQTVDTSAWIIGEQIRRESEAHATEADFVIADRSPIDVVSHLLDAAGSDGRAAAVIDLARAWTATYDWIYRAPFDPRAPVAADGVRVVDKQYQRLLDSRMDEAVALVAPGLPKQLPGNTQDRVTNIIADILPAPR